jgi:hypothetical protein
MELQEDLDSFRAPLDAAVADRHAAVTRAALPVRGSDERVRRAQEAKAAIERFGPALATRLEEQSFAQLPRLRRWGLPIPHLHRLDQGPWRGVFLLDPKGERVVALVFSKAPHDYGDKLAELVVLYMQPPTEDGGGDG